MMGMPPFVPYGWFVTDSALQSTHSVSFQLPAGSDLSDTCVLVHLDLHSISSASVP